jgi:hypothetical protein
VGWDRPGGLIDMPPPLPPRLLPPRSSSSLRSRAEGTTIRRKAP